MCTHSKGLAMQPKPTFITPSFLYLFTVALVFNESSDGRVFTAGRYLPCRICITCVCTIARGWGNCLSSVNFYYCLWIPKRYPRKSSWVLDVVLPRSGTRSLWQRRPITTARGLLFCLLISVRWEAQNDQMEIFSKSVDTSMFPGRVFCSLGIESPNPNQKCSEGKYSCVSRP